MRQSTDFMEAIVDFDIDPKAILWRAGCVKSIKSDGDAIKITIPFRAFKLENGFLPAEDLKIMEKTFYLEYYAGGIIRFTEKKGLSVNSPMLEPCKDLLQHKLYISEKSEYWEINLDNGEQIAVFHKAQPPVKGWSELIRPSFESLSGTFFPDSSSVEFSAYDQFFPEKVESLPLAYAASKNDEKTLQSVLFSFHSDHNEHFCGTGERFSRMDLAGETLSLENTDGLGNNSRRAYKNVPFYLSSRRYGLFIHTSSHLRLSLADVSTRAAQGRIEDDQIDLFIINGPEPETILHNYRRITGFPPELPTWSYGTWMARMTYFSAEEIEEITARMRAEKYPCDLIHIDTGWFETDWVCEWKFSEQRFPEPEEFMKRLKNDGFRVSLWQTPNIGEGNCLLEEAKEKRYLAPPKEKSVTTASDFSGQDFGGQIDFTNPEAVSWYQDKIRKLLEAGASVIKTDFGEKIQLDADYMNMPPEKLHNIYGLLYQKAAFEQTVKTTGEGIIWARAGWAGAQRYPLHWGGDTACSWDGMAAVLRGGLHLGMSGFGFWSHDVPGFHGLPEFMNTMPSDNLYIRWTQMAVFTSHIRYHGTSPREPWYYPEISDLIRRWLNFRYTLIPYIVEQAKKTTETGMPVLRAMALHHPEDNYCWHIDDQFFFGDSFLVCPVMNDSGIRDVYLPEGSWIDFWTGQQYDGPLNLKDIKSDIATLPLFCPINSEISIYPETVQCTDEMDLSKAVLQKIGSNFKGIELLYRTIQLFHQ